MLPVERRAALAGVEEDPREVAVDLEHRERREHRRAGDDQRVGGDRGRPREQRHPPPGHPRRAHSPQRRDEVDRQQHHPGEREPAAEDPGVDPVVGRESRVGERRPGVNADVGGREDDRRVERQAADREEPEREVGEPREGELSRADLERHDVGEEPEHQRQGEEEDQRRPVQGHHPVEEGGGDQVALGHSELEPHDQELDQRDDEEAERAGDQHPADVLVVAARRELDPARPRRRDPLGDDLGVGLGEGAVGGKAHR